MKIFYQLDGGAEIAFAQDSGVLDLSTVGTCASSISGDSVRIVARSLTTGDDEFYTLNNVTLAVDSGSNITSTASTLFTRESGNWNNTSV